jgi:hypothetical protein
VKDKSLAEERRKPISANARPQHQPERSFFNAKNMSLSSARYENQQQHKNNTNSITFSDSNKSNNDRYKSNSKSLKRHTARSESVHEVKSSVNDTKHVNFNKRMPASPSAEKNQYQTGGGEQLAYLRSSTSTVSKYHMPSAMGPNSYNSHSSSSGGNNPYANTVHTETVEQPTLMELECIAGYDGGLPQYFFLEAYDSRTRKLRLNITSALNDVPLFRIDLAGRLRVTSVLGLLLLSLSPSP